MTNPFDEKKSFKSLHPPICTLYLNKAERLIFEELFENSNEKYKKDFLRTIFFDYANKKKNS